MGVTPLGSRSSVNKALNCVFDNCPGTSQVPRSNIWSLLMPHLLLFVLMPLSLAPCKSPAVPSPLSSIPNRAGTVHQPADQLHRAPPHCTPGIPLTQHLLRCDRDAGGWQLLLPRARRPLCPFGRPAHRGELCLLTGWRAHRSFQQAPSCPGGIVSAGY